MSDTPTGFAAEWLPPESIPPRRWIYGNFLIRGHLSVVAAPGGTGKSSYVLASCIAMATGRDLLGQDLPEGPLRVLVFNLEDPADEFNRRIAAVMQHYGITVADLGGRLFVRHGRDQPFQSHKRTDKNGKTIKTGDDLTELLLHVTQERIDVVVVDPFISSHEASENSNEEMDLVAKDWTRFIAGPRDIAVLLVHHCRKTGNNDASIDSIRGGKALTDAARVAITLNPMSDGEASHYGLSPDERDRLVSVSYGKSNMTARNSTKFWFRLQSVALGNGDNLHPSGDNVGVPVPWQPPKEAAWTTEQLADIQKKLGAAEYRQSHQAKDGVWAGVVVAEVMGLNPEDDRKRISGLLGSWLSRGHLKKTSKRGKNGRDVPLLVPGQPAAPDTSWYPSTTPVGKGGEAA